MSNLPEYKESARSVTKKRRWDGLTLASEFCNQLVELINQFDSELDDEHEVAMRLVSFGQEIAFHVDGLGYYDPSLIVFLGRLSDGEPVELIQHVAQISFLLMAVKRLNPDEPKRKIGFIAGDK